MRDAAAVALNGSERGMAKMGRSGNWKLDDRKLSRRKFLSWRNEKFRDVNFPSRTTESCPDVNRPSRTRRVGIEDANIPSQVHPANRNSISDQSDSMS